MANEFKVRNLHIIRRAALMFVFDTCPYCGHANDGVNFTLDLGDGLSLDFDTTDSQIDFCHLDARSLNGSNTDENLTVGHHACNIAQGRRSIEVHCKLFRTVLTASEIRAKSLQAKQLADDMIEGRNFYTPIAKIAAKMIADGKPHRTGKEWMEKIQRAA